MGQPKKNKKAEIRARRKTRKAHERIADLKRREKMIKAYLKVISENAETLQKLAESEELDGIPTDQISDELSSSPDDQSSQSPSE